MIIGGVLLVGFLIYSFTSKTTSQQKEPYVPQYNAEQTLKENDKLIIVGNTDLETLKQVVSDFTRNYDNPKDVSLKPVSKIRKIDDSKFAVTLPYDIDFEIFSYYVNYLKYPIDVKYHPTVLAWTSTSSSYQWLNDTFDNNKVIMFIDPSDNEYDSVMVITEDGKPFEIGYAVGYELQAESNVIQKYEQPPFSFSELAKYESLKIK